MAFVFNLTSCGLSQWSIPIEFFTVSLRSFYLSLTSAMNKFKTLIQKEEAM